MSLQPIVRDLNEVEAVWEAYDDYNSYCCEGNGNAMVTDKENDEWIAATVMAEVSMPADVSCRTVCKECKKAFPSGYWLDLHMTEVHDVIFKTKVEHETCRYPCIVRGCKKQFKGLNERAQHLRSVHKFSHEFNFESMHLKSVKALKSAGQMQKVAQTTSIHNDLEPNLTQESGFAAPAPGNLEGSSEADDVQNVVSSMEALSTAFVPRSVHMRSGQNRPQ